MLEHTDGEQGSAGVNVWISFADLFAGLLLIVLLGLIVTLSNYKKLNEELRFSRELQVAINQAVEVNTQMRSRLTATLPPTAEPLSYSETALSIPSVVLFRSFSYDDFLQDKQRLEVLALVRGALKDALDQAGPQRKYLKVVIEGHTDSDPIRRDASTQAIPTNWELSSRRATGVLRYFEEGGMSASEYDIRAMGLADTVPVASNTSEEGKERNRRIVIRIEPDLEKIKAASVRTQ